MPKLSSRTDTFTESMIRKMTRISLDNNAIDLFPNFRLKARNYKYQR